jgi:hypothetical protein
MVFIKQNKMKEKIIKRNLINYEEFFFLVLYYFCFYL